MLTVFLRARRRRCVVWLVALTVLFGALLPAFAAAAARGAGGEAWLEICTAYGIERVAVDADASGDESPSRGEPCEWCRLQNVVPAILALPTAGCLSWAHGAAPTPPIRSVLPAHASHWQPASPRAPPARS